MIIEIIILKILDFPIWGQYNIGMKFLFRFEIVSNYIKKNGYLKDEFCEHCGIEIEELNKMQEGDWSFKIESLFKIANFINVEMFEFFMPYPIPAKYDLG